MTVRVYCLLIRKTGQLPPRCCFWLGTQSKIHPIHSSQFSKPVSWFDHVHVVLSLSRNNFVYFSFPNILDFVTTSNVTFSTVHSLSKRQGKITCLAVVVFLTTQLRVPAVFVQVDRLLAIVVGDGKPSHLVPPPVLLYPAVGRLVV